MRLLPSALLLSLAAAPLLFASPQFDAARELYSQRKDAEAREAFTALVRTEPKNADVPFYLGALAMRARDFDTAIKHFEQATALEPTKSAYFLELGVAYANKAQSSGLLGKATNAAKSRTALEKAVELDPKNVDARSGLTQFYSQAPAFMGGGIDKAHAQADAMIQLDPFRGKIAKAGLFAREKKFDEAFALYEATLKTQPDDYNALYQTGRLAADTGQRLDQGAAALQKVLAQTPPAGAPGHAPAHWRLGMIWEKKGDKAAAKSAYEASLKVDPKFQPAVEALKKLG